MTWRKTTGTPGTLVYEDPVLVQKKLGLVNATVATVTFDAPPSPGNLIVACHYLNHSDANQTPPANMIRAIASNIAAGSESGRIYYRVATEGESSSVTWTSGIARLHSLAIFEFSKCSRRSPLDRTASGNSNVGSNSISTNATAVTRQARQVLVAVSYMNNGFADNAWSNGFVSEGNNDSGRFNVAVGIADTIGTYETTRSHSGAASTLRIALLAGFRARPV